MYGGWKCDPTAFIFQLKPNIKVFNQRRKDGFEAVYHERWCLINFGGGDLYIIHKCNIDTIGLSGANPVTYNFRNGSDIVGGKTKKRCEFTVIDMETFAVEAS